MIEKLDSDEFQTRQNAQKELETLGSIARKQLKDAAQNSKSDEVRRRAKNALDAIHKHERDVLSKYLDWLFDRRRDPRYTGLVKETLQRVAKGDPDSFLTQYAKQLLKDLENELKLKNGSP